MHAIVDLLCGVSHARVGEKQVRIPLRCIDGALDDITLRPRSIDPSKSTEL